MTGREMVLTLDSIISAPYYTKSHAFSISQLKGTCIPHTFTTRDEALPCSYARSAEVTSGRCDMRETKGELVSHEEELAVKQPTDILA